MPNPSFVSNLDIHSNGKPLPTATLLTNWVIQYDTLDQQGQADLATLVTANGGTLPLSSISVAKNTILGNGKSWYDTYVASTKTVPGATDPGVGADRSQIYYDANAVAWKYKYNGGTVTAGGGGGSGTVTQVNGQSPDGSGHITVNPAQIGALGLPSTWNGATNTPTLTAGTAPTGNYNSFTVTGCPSATGVSLGSVTTVTNGDVIWFDGTVWQKSAAIPSTTGLFKGDGAGNLVAASPFTDYTPPPCIQRTIPVGWIGSFTFGANGALTVGVQPVGVSLTTSATSGTVTVTAAGGTPFTSASVGLVITLDGTKQITITAFTNTTTVTGTVSGGTLSTTSFATWTIFAPMNGGQFDSTNPFFPYSWFYFPANSITASNAAGFYYTVFSNSTCATVYQNTYVPGSTSPAVPTSPTPFVAAAGSVTTNALASQLYTDKFVIPGGYIGPSGRMTTFGVLQNNNSATGKSYSATLNTNICGLTGANTTLTQMTRLQSWFNVGEKRQISTLLGDSNTGGTSGSSNHTTVDTTVSTTFAFSLTTTSTSDWAAITACYAQIVPGL